MSAVSYNLIVTSFNDDYYYGQIVRKDEEGKRHFIANVEIDLDDDYEMVFFFDVFDGQMETDFEVTNRDSLKDEIEGRIMLQKKEIFDTVKRKGEIFEWAMLDAVETE